MRKKNSDKGRKRNRRQQKPCAQEAEGGLLIHRGEVDAGGQKARLCKLPADPPQPKDQLKN